MAKKRRSKKARRRRKERKLTAAPAKPRTTPTPVQAQPVPRPRVASQTAKPQRYQVDFRKEYPYIYSDLERVGIIAAGMLVFMVVLSLILK